MTRILVVDDNQDAAKTLVMLLQLTGNETQVAHDGLAAFEAASLWKPDVILLDIGLPKMSGHEVCRKIREQAWGRNMIIIALTGWSRDDDRRDSSDAGFNGHLVKPVEYSDLTALLAELLSTSQSTN